MGKRYRVKLVDTGGDGFVGSSPADHLFGLDRPENLVELFMENGYEPRLVTSYKIPLGHRSWSLVWQDFKSTVYGQGGGQGSQIFDSWAIIEIVYEAYGHADL